jgi:hypothetical protein
MSLMERQLAELLSAQPKKRPPAAAKEGAKPGGREPPSLEVLFALLKPPPPMPAPPPPTIQGQPLSEMPSPQPQPAMQAPPAMQPRPRIEPKAPPQPVATSEATSFYTGHPSENVLPFAPDTAERPSAAPGIAAESPAPVDKPKKKRPDIKFSLQSTGTGSLSPFAKQALPFIKGMPGDERPAATPPTESAAPPREASAAPPKNDPDPGQKPTNLQGTVTGTVSPFAKAPLPFSPAPAGQSPPPAAQSAAEAPPSADLNTTTLGSVSPFASALPFGASPANRAPSPAKSTAQSPAPGAVQSPKGRLDRTADEIVSPFQSKALPFQQEPQAAPSPPTNASARPSPTSTRGLSIEQYASLCAELATYPAQTEQVFLRYRLATAQDRSAVDNEWRARLAKDPAEYKRWHDLYWQYCTYLKQRR